MDIFISTAQLGNNELKTEFSVLGAGTSPCRGFGQRPMVLRLKGSQYFAFGKQVQQFAYANASGTALFSPLRKSHTSHVRTSLRYL